MIKCSPTVCPYSVCIALNDGNQCPLVKHKDTIKPFSDKTQQKIINTLTLGEQLLNYVRGIKNGKKRVQESKL